ncbi:hypothetical protein BGX21_005973, partial [Mortierella sp. AD011]
LIYKDSKYDIAKRLAGAVIQRGRKAILAVKEEVYGRDFSEDPHWFDMTRPTPDVRKYAQFFTTTALACDLHTWSAPITLSIELTSGDIEVSANNSSASVATCTMFLGRKGFDQKVL